MAHSRQMPTPMIATDLDGTLLMSGSHEPHPESAAAVRQALAAGIPIVFATGRTPYDVLPIAEAVGHRWYAVCCDGTAIVDLRTETVIRTHPLELDVKLEVVKRLRSRFPAVRFLVDRVSPGPITAGRYGLVVEDGFEAPWAWALEGASATRSILEVLEDPNIVKMCAFLPDDGTHPGAFNRVVAEVSELVTATRIHSEKTFVDMNRRGVSKASGVAELAEMEGVPVSEVFAVGDMHNDVSMLQWAGRSFAVENALEHVRDAADIIVPSNDRGGVAHVVAAALAHLRDS